MIIETSKVDQIKLTYLPGLFSVSQFMLFKKQYFPSLWNVSFPVLLRIYDPEKKAKKTS